MLQPYAIDFKFNRMFVASGYCEMQVYKMGWKKRECHNIGDETVVSKSESGKFSCACSIRSTTLLGH